MSKAGAHCVLLADPHHGMSEAIHDLLATAFEAVVRVADEVSLFECAGRLQNELTVVDLALARGDGVELVRRIRAQFPEMKLIIVSIHDQASVSRSVLEAGADGFVAKHSIAGQLLTATDAVLAGQRYVSSEVAQ